MSELFAFLQKREKFIPKGTPFKELDMQESIHKEDTFSEGRQNIFYRVSSL